MLLPDKMKVLKISNLCIHSIDYLFFIFNNIQKTEFLTFKALSFYFTSFL